MLPLLTRNHEEVVLVDGCITSSGSKSDTSSVSSDQLVLVFNKQVMLNCGSFVTYVKLRFSLRNMIHRCNRLRFQVAVKSASVLLVCNFESSIFPVLKRDELHGKFTFRVLVILIRVCP